MQLGKRSFTASYMSPLLLVAQHAMIAFTTASSVTYSSIAIRMAAAHRGSHPGSSRHTRHASTSCKDGSAANITSTPGQISQWRAVGEWAIALMRKANAAVWTFENVRRIAPSKTQLKDLEMVRMRYGHEDCHVIVPSFTMETGGKVPKRVCEHVDKYLRKRIRQGHSECLQCLNFPTPAELTKIG